jgi:hypothetical protein
MVLRKGKIEIGKFVLPSPTRADQKERELIETQRSVADAQLRTGDLFIRDYHRYTNRPADTAYSLEYA